MENRYENKSYQEQLYLMFEQYKDEAILLDTVPFNYQHYFVDDNFLYVFERCENPEMIDVYSLSLLFLTNEELTIALQGKFHCSVKLSTQLGLINIDAKQNFYYQEELILLDNRIKLPKGMYIGDINEIVFLDTMKYCLITCKETKLYHLYLDKAYPELNCFVEVS